MKRLLAPTLLALSIGLGTIGLSDSAFANNRKSFSSTISTPAAPVSINITLSEDLLYRADHMSKKLRDRSRSRGINNGFSGNGYLGQRDLDRLAARLEKKLTYQLNKSGVEVVEDAPNVLNIVIKDAIPNRPTFEQLSKHTSLSFRSFGIGGATFEGTMTSNGEEAGSISYAWYETDITQTGAHGSTWYDANYAIDRFSRKAGKSFR
jgi:hypothetical protein